MFEFFEIIFLSRIANNTAVNAQIAAMPEFAKEANWLAQGLYQQARRDTIGTRFLRNLGMLIVTGASGIIELANPTTQNGWILAGLVCFWMFIAAFSSAKARNQTTSEACNTVSEKKMKEDIIRETMYKAAVNRLQLQ